MIAPGWMISKIPDKAVDLVINMRSMMEMTNAIVSFYFEEIQQIVKNDGLFACFNRYIKKYYWRKCNFENYPFDSYWKIVLSQTSTFQKYIQDIVVQRQLEENLFPVCETLKTLPLLDDKVNGRLILYRKNQHEQG